MKNNFAIVDGQGGSVARLNIDCISTRFYIKFFTTPFETPTYEWRSSNTNVATVNSNGVVTRIGVGEAEIYGVVNDGNLLEKFELIERAKVYVQREKTMIVGASTVSQMGNQRFVAKDKNNKEVMAKINYRNKWGFSVSKIDGADYTGIHKDYVIDSSNLVERHNLADLFFACKSGSGLQWLGDGNTGGGKNEIKTILRNNGVIRDEFGADVPGFGEYPHFNIIF